MEKLREEIREIFLLSKLCQAFCKTCFNLHGFFFLLRCKLPTGNLRSPWNLPLGLFGRITFFKTGEAGAFAISAARNLFYFIVRLC
jgi:hypothetical protein